MDISHYQILLTLLVNIKAKTLKELISGVFLQEITLKRKNNQKSRLS